MDTYREGTIILNCRRINEHLSAYLDRELPAEEAQIIAEHLDHCSACRLEYDTLRHTKRAVSSLAGRVSRDDIARLLADATPPSGSATGIAGTPNKLLPGLATVMFSLAGLWLATTSLDAPHDAQRAVGGEFAPVTAGVAPTGMASLFTPLTDTVTVTPIAAPITVYAVGPLGEIRSRAVFQQVQVQRTVSPEGSLRRIVARLFGHGATTPASSSPSVTSFVGGGYSEAAPVLRPVTVSAGFGDGSQTVYHGGPLFLAH